MTTSWPEVVAQFAKSVGLLSEIYGDVAKPGVQQVGKALATVLGLGNTCLWPLAILNGKAEIALTRNLETFREKLATVPMEKIVPVAPEVGVPIAEKLGYVRDENLANLYLNLLLKASCSNTVHQAHPAFVNVISDLAPDEATLLEYVFEEDCVIYLHAKWQHPVKPTYTVAGDLLLSPSLLDQLTFPQNAPAYLHHLAGLGLLKAYPDRQAAAGNYSDVTDHWRDQLEKSRTPDEFGTLNFQQGIVLSTDFGRQFIEACHSKANEMTTLACRP